MMQHPAVSQDKPAHGESSYLDMSQWSYWMSLKICVPGLDSHWMTAQHCVLTWDLRFFIKFSKPHQNSLGVDSSSLNFLLSSDVLS
jgi:hypothetical protein